MTRPVVVTGGAGFIGTNLADRLLANGQAVMVFDNLSRSGVEANLAWLKRKYGSEVEFVHGDVRDPEAVRGVVNGASAVYHFAAQVAVTTSLVDPGTDFDVNARGTLNVLEAIRRSGSRTPLLFTSTNKVYGDLEDVGLRGTDSRYVPTNPQILMRGVSEDRRLSFHSPYGCSKGTADQYVLDYSRSFGMRTVVFRMSCIYGPHQFGTEDQGWVAHFLIRALKGEPITLYGDGRQVRDILFVEDLVDAFLLAHRYIDRLSGNAYNIGGGPQNAVSLMELLQIIREITGEKPRVEFEEWRIGDQRYYVSDTRRFSNGTGWHPAVKVRTGVEALAMWLSEANPAMALEHVATGQLLREGVA